MKRFLILLLVYLSIVAGGAAAKHEMRGVWVATVWGIDWPSRQGTDKATVELQQAEMDRLLDQCADLNLTTVIFQVRSMGDAMYRSTVEPSSRFLTGKRGAPLAWDPLERMVEGCHARGMECYAWVNPFRVPADKDATTDFDRLCRERGRVLTYGKYSTLNPGMEEVRKHIVDVCREIVGFYDVDGLIFDDYFYPNGIPEDSTAPDYQLYLSEDTDMSIGEWRRSNVHKLVADVSAMIFDECPDVRFGISPAGVAGKNDTSARHWGITGVDVKAADWQWREIFSDPVGWLYQGTVDFVSPQLYWPTTHATAPFAPLARWWDYAAGRHGRHSYPSITLADLDKGARADLVDDHLKQVDIAGELSTPGVILYSAKYLDRISAPLKARHFTSKAISPSADRKYPHYYEPVTGLTRKGDTLRWDETEPDVEGAIIRYAVYAYPKGMSLDDVADSGGDDGIDSAYLLGLTYQPEFKLPGEARSGKTYAVAVVDGNSIEHPYSILK